MRVRGRSSHPVLRAAATAFLLVATLAGPAVAQSEETPAAIDEAAPAEPAPAEAEPAAVDSAEPAAVDSAEPAPDALAFKPIRLPFAPDRLAASNYGMNVFLWGHPETTQRDLGTLQMAGFGWQKSLFQWRTIEPGGKYAFNWREADRVVEATNKAGIKVLARIDFAPDWTRADRTTYNGRPDNPQHFADFLRVFADRYKTGSPHGHVDAVEIWNEPNLQREWGTPISARSAAEYVQMLKMAYRTIKAIDPSILVVTAGLSPTGWDDDTARPDDRFLQWMFDAGLSGSYDVLGLHGNGQAPDPTADPGTTEGFVDASFYFRRVEQLRAIQEANGDGARPVWLLEFGWTSDPVHPQYSWFAVDENRKADNILSAIQYARANWPWLQVMTLWTMPDPTWGPEREEYWWALANPDGTYRPAMDRLIEAAQGGLLPGMPAAAP